MDGTYRAYFLSLKLTNSYDDDDDYDNDDDDVDDVDDDDDDNDDDNDDNEEDEDYNGILCEKFKELKG